MGLGVEGLMCQLMTDRKKLRSHVFLWCFYVASTRVYPLHGVCVYICMQMYVYTQAHNIIYIYIYIYTYVYIIYIYAYI